MHTDPPRPVVDALRTLLGACVEAARHDDGVRRSLKTLSAWIDESVDAPAREGQGRGRRGAESKGHGVLTPASRTRGEASPSQRSGPASSEGKPAGRITSPLSTVVTRARWKASACRLGLERHALLVDGKGEGDGERTGAELDRREASLRERLGSHPDTSTWMLDMPFGKRRTDPTATEVDPAAVEALGVIADCYETIATGAEIAMELDEAGAFDGGPAPGFLYLLAEAQSALLQSLGGAPTRSDSDQRDVFLWLKEQTTRYRIYVDRFMRLDDPADPKGSRDLAERFRRAAREILQRQGARQKRRELIGKVRYHAGKLAMDGGVRLLEVQSLDAALKVWKEAGLQLNDRLLIEVLEPLHAVDLDESTEGGAALARTLSALPTSRSRPQDQSGGGGGARGAASSKGETPEETRRQLESCRVGLLALEGDDGVDQEALARDLGAAELLVTRVSLDAAHQASRVAAIDSFLDSGVDVFLLGARLPRDEYASFKERCLERQGLFVRLPGALDGASILHQVTRQVGWRLRARATRTRR